jgi:RNA polymerase sigma-70 factor (ECF subfamily)
VYEQIDDKALILAFQNGDPDADSTLFDRFFEPLCLFSERITTDLQQSEDIVTESFMKLIDRRKDFPGVPQLKSFLYRTVHNASINQIIASRRHQAIHEKIRYLHRQDETAEKDYELEILRAELIRDIFEEIENLPDRCGQIFKLIFVEQLSSEEIGARLSINPQTVRTQKARAISLIRTALLKKNRWPAWLLLFAWLQHPPHN